MSELSEQQAAQPVKPFNHIHPCWAERGMPPVIVQHPMHLILRQMYQRGLHSLVGTAPAAGLEALVANGRWCGEGLQGRHVMQNTCQECLFWRWSRPAPLAEALQEIHALLEFYGVPEKQLRRQAKLRAKTRMPIL